VALPAFAEALLLLTTDRASINISWQQGPQQQTRSSGQMDGRMPNSCIDPTPHTMWAVQINV